jgi:hypothetical protein
MKRRTFLQSMAGAFALPFIPTNLIEKSSIVSEPVAKPKGYDPVCPHCSQKSMLRLTTKDGLFFICVNRDCGVEYKWACSITVDKWDSKHG